ncbi:MAG: cupin domain-containing protein [Chloroflexi bacterium]|nr:cupin domain-containing protein [Chloroflexota bacterium]
MGEKRILVDTNGYQPGRSVMKKEEIRLKPSSIKGFYMGRIIAHETGFMVRTTILDLYHIAPGRKTVPCRQDEMLLHILSGEGYSIIDDVKYEWEAGDTIHIKPGYWHQHFNTSGKGVNMLCARLIPLLNYVMPLPLTSRQGAEFKPVGDYVPEHPFGLGKIPVIDQSDEPDKEWPNRPSGRWERQQNADRKQQWKQGRTIMKGKDVRWERSATHRGEFNAFLAHASLGFDARSLSMALQTTPPGGCNETHQHNETIVYILRGRGYVLVNDERFDLEEGDTCVVHWADWHQFWSLAGPNDPPFTQLRIMFHLNQYVLPFPYFEEGEDSTVRDFDPEYIPQLPW